MGFSIETSVPILTVFLQGLLSFFSPCVLPLLPMYISYLSGGGRTMDQEGNVHYKRGRVLLNTAFFVVGISFAFFLLGFGFTAAGKFFPGKPDAAGPCGRRAGDPLWPVPAGGVRLLQAAEPGGTAAFPPGKVAMNPLVALVLGFTFSFAWTPCVGPTLASVLLMATSAKAAQGFVLIGVYTLGFVLPFLAVGLFTSTLLEVFRKYKNVVKYTVKIGGILMVFMGVMMFTGWMNNLTNYLSSFGGTESSTTSVSSTVEESQVVSAVESSQESEVSESPSQAVAQESSAQESSTPEENTPVSAPDFTLTDQFGNTHTLSDYQGKTVFLNFWGTWCPPCRAEMPEIQELYEEYGENTGDVVILGVALPNVGKEGSQEEIAAFLEENGYTYPTVMDEEGKISAYSYYISAFPTTFMIDANGNVYGYVSGQLTKDIMKDIIQQTIDGSSAQ